VTDFNPNPTTAATNPFAGRWNHGPTEFQVRQAALASAVALIRRHDPDEQAADVGNILAIAKAFEAYLTGQREGGEVPQPPRPNPHATDYR
jgi:hypothetical protein